MTKIFLATLLAFTATPALAQPPVTVSTIVQTADLDLSSADGQRRLDHRLGRAANEVCGTASQSDLAGQNDTRDCIKDVLARVAGERDQRIAAASRQPIVLASR